jgi:hypothetical protein
MRLAVNVVDGFAADSVLKRRVTREDAPLCVFIFGIVLSLVRFLLTLLLSQLLAL